MTFVTSSVQSNGSYILVLQNILAINAMYDNLTICTLFYMTTINHSLTPPPPRCDTRPCSRQSSTKTHPIRRNPRLRHHNTRPHSRQSLTKTRPLPRNPRLRRHNTRPHSRQSMTKTRPLPRNPRLRRHNTRPHSRHATQTCDCFPCI